MLKLVLAAAAVLSLGACSTVDLKGFAEAANELDPGCKKEVRATVTPVLLFGWPVPVISGEYYKGCNLEQGAGPQPLGLTAGSVLPGTP